MAHWTSVWSIRCFRRANLRRRRANEHDRNGDAGIYAWPVRPLYAAPRHVRVGGPVALVGYMHRDLVEQRKWITEDDYREGLALAQMMPGPLAAQLGIYLGHVHYHVVGTHSPVLRLCFRRS
jgi:hypothetical protein